MHDHNYCALILVAGMWHSLLVEFRDQDNNNFFQ